jgi:lipopolysaccharide export system ATP-binding protein
VLETAGLTKHYGKRRVVDNVSFTVGKGEVVGLLGKNGAGKTTSFRMTMGMIRPDAGTVRLLGEDVSNLPMYKRARLGMGYLAQEKSVFRGLTTRQNLLATLEATDLARRERKARAEELIKDFGLSKVADSYADTLSGGECRRLEIARALTTNPKIILLDEPFTGIDPIAISELKTLVLGLVEKGISILITDHNVRDTLVITDRAYIMEEGKTLASGTPEELVANELVRKAYLGEDFSSEFLIEKRKRKENKVGG